jgi:hypothetical protein
MTRSVIAPSFSSGDTKLNFSELGMVSPELRERQNEARTGVRSGIIRSDKLLDFRNTRFPQGESGYEQRRR